MWQLQDRIDPRVLGGSLREARKTAGLTQQAVAKELGIARTTVVAIEKGARSVRANEILRLADLYGRPVPELVGRRRVTGGFKSLLRAQNLNSPVSGAECEKAVYELQILAEGYVDLEARLETQERRQLPPEYASKRVRVRDAADGIATCERNRMSLGDGPVGNLYDRLEADIGLRIFSFEMPSKLAGLFAYTEELGPCVAINARHPREQRHWTLAHEYGHFLMHRYRMDVNVLGRSCSKARQQRLANAFAERFLMPASGLNRRFTEAVRTSGAVTVGDLARLADLYRVPFQSMVRRLEILRRIPSGTWTRFKADALKPSESRTMLGTRQSEVAIEERFPRRYVSLAVQAYKRAMLSEEQLAHLLRANRIETRIVVERHDQAVRAEDGGEFIALQLDLGRTLTVR